MSPPARAAMWCAWMRPPANMLWMLLAWTRASAAPHAPRQYSGRGVWPIGPTASDERILYVTPGYRLVALDAQTGVPVKSFGEDGIVDLKLNDDQDIDLVTGDVGLHATPAGRQEYGDRRRGASVGRRAARSATMSKAMCAASTSAPASANGFSTPSRARASSAMTPGLDPGEAEQTGNTGCWGQISADPELGLAYLPVELPTGD